MTVHSGTSRRKVQACTTITKADLDSAQALADAEGLSLASFLRRAIVLDVRARQNSDAG